MEEKSIGQMDESDFLSAAAKARDSGDEKGAGFYTRLADLRRIQAMTPEQVRSPFPRHKIGDQSVGPESSKPEQSKQSQASLDRQFAEELAYIEGAIDDANQDGDPATAKYLAAVKARVQSQHHDGGAGY